MPIQLDHLHLGSLVRLIRSRDFAADPTAAALARGFVRQCCEEIGERSREAELLVSELVTNALVHAETPCRVTFVALEGRPWWIEVKDWSIRPPTPRSATPTDPGGRGYELMDSLSHWHADDIDQLNGSKVVCFTLKGEADDDSNHPTRGATCAPPLGSQLGAELEWQPNHRPGSRPLGLRWA
ncbi:ATP-binding protein [Kitasatospora sp. NPDC057940]|uniref:ATP-binding protein n=1 Tax=Kitasatospora sp. NPDC057940 TaxID=3346285 RepID=UPI0036DB366B